MKNQHDRLTAEAAGTSNYWILGVVLGGVWLLFLGMPALELLSSPAGWATKALGLAALLSFSAVYLAGLTITMRDGCPDRRSIRLLIALVVIMIASFAVLGPNALSLTPYLIALTAFSTTGVRGIVITAAVIVLSCAVIVWHSAIASGDGRAYLIIVNLSVGGFTLAVNWLNRRESEFQQTCRELALVSEREAVARDVHDLLGHSLTVITMKSELAERLLDTDPERARAELRDIHQLSREAITEVRTTVSGLRVRSLDAELRAARQALELAGLRADLPSDGREADPGNRLLFAWALREAITNVVRHARASVCRVEVSSDRLVVADDGCGLDGSSDDAMTTGNGLSGLRSRVEQAGGQLLITAEPSGGTRLEVLL